MRKLIKWGLAIGFTLSLVSVAFMLWMDVSDASAFKDVPNPLQDKSDDLEKDVDNG